MPSGELSRSFSAQWVGSLYVFTQTAREAGDSQQLLAEPKLF